MGDECLKVMLIWGVLSLIVACVLTWVRPGPTEDIEGYMRQEGFSCHDRKELMRLFLFGMLAPSFGLP